MRISDAGDHLGRVYRDWRGFLANPEYEVRGSIVCWHNCRTEMLPDSVSFDDVSKLASDRQYSFQVAADGSVIQLLYEFDDSHRTVTQARLAFYQAPLQAEDDLGEAFAAVEAPDEDGKGQFVSEMPQWIRIDYENGGSACPTHADCHMHLSGFPDTRIALSNLPNPRQFLELTFAWFYPEAYRGKRLTALGQYKDAGWMKFINRNSMPCEDTATTKHLAHLRLPRNTLF